jgi:hypothetical protein
MTRESEAEVECFVFYQLGRVEYWNKELGGTNISTEDRLRGCFWRDTGYVAVARINPYERYGGMYLMFNFWPINEEWDARCADARYTCKLPGKTGSRYICLRVCNEVEQVGHDVEFELTPVTVGDEEVEIVRAVKDGHGDIVRQTK